MRPQTDENPKTWRDKQKKDQQPSDLDSVKYSGYDNDVLAVKIRGRRSLDGEALVVRDIVALPGQ